MSEASTLGADRATERRSADRLLRTAIAFGIAAGVLAALAAGVVALRFMDRHFVLATGMRDLWDYLWYIVDTAVFAVAYVAVPVVWVILTVRWWLTRSLPSGRIWKATVIPLFFAGVFGMWAWITTAFRTIDWVFGVDLLPRSLADLGLSDVDQWEALVVAGLACLIGCIGVTIAFMIREARR